MVRKNPASKIAAKGQTTIRMTPALDAKAVAGMLAPAPRRVTIEKMRAAIRKRGSRP